MKIRKLAEQEPEKRAKSLEKIISGLRKGEDSNSKEAIMEVIADKKLKLGTPEKNIAIDLVEKAKLIDAIPALYPLLSVPVASGIGERINEPFNAMVAIGKKGLPELIRSIQADDQELIPYSVIANILYHWFDGDRSTLRGYLVEEGNKASDKKFKTEFERLLSIVDSWKN